MTSSVEFDAVILPDWKGWLYRPLLRGLVKYESYKDGTLNLCDIDELNEALDVLDENDARAREASRRQGGGG